MQPIVHAQEPVMRSIQLAYCGYGMLTHVDEDSVSWSQPLPIFAVKGAPHLRTAVSRHLDPDLDGLWQHQGA